MRIKRLISTLLTLSMLVSVLAAAGTTASAAETGRKTMNMGGSVISAAATKAKDRDVIYYGNQTKWRVLSTVGNTIDSDGNKATFNNGTVAKKMPCLSFRNIISAMESMPHSFLIGPPAMQKTGATAPFTKMPELRLQNVRQS